MIKTTGIDHILDDNSLMYLCFIISASYAADPEMEIQFHKNGAKLTVIITPSQDNFKKHIILNILRVHKLIGLYPEMSKSSKKQKLVSFSIEF